MDGCQMDGSPIPVANPHGLGQADGTRASLHPRAPDGHLFPWADLPGAGTEGDVSGQSTPSAWIHESRAELHSYS